MLYQPNIALLNNGCKEVITEMEKLLLRTVDNDRSLSHFHDYTREPKIIIEVVFR